jgi:16S rRNA G966 N2-methylase RsmD
MMQKPFKSYLGGKESSGVYQTIINHIPKHKTLIIPFLGNCAVFRNIASADNTILIDADPRVIKAWAGIITKEDRSGIITINDDAISHLQKCRYDQDTTVIYADPPYPISTRSSRNTKYEYDLTDKDHTALLMMLLQMKCKILISTYENELYKKMLSTWKLIKYKSQTRSGSRTELLYMNFDINDFELHDYSYLGNNFRQRERIKKKIKRHSDRLLRLPKFEALAIMKQLSRDLNIINDVPARNSINDDVISSAVTSKTTIQDLIRINEDVSC